MTTAPNKVVEMPRLTKQILCGKCGCELVVSERTVLAFCRDCSATMGEKK
jgi:uncharacterized CHY-type Zn-finger protein